MTKDEAFIDSPLDWPAFPFLPLKRRPKGGGFWEDGLLMALPEKRYTVVECNIFMRPATVAEFWKLPQHEYQSAAEIVADGWLVD